MSRCVHLEARLEEYKTKLAKIESSKEKKDE